VRAPNLVSDDQHGWRACPFVVRHEVSAEQCWDPGEAEPARRHGAEDDVFRCRRPSLEAGVDVSKRAHVDDGSQLVAPCQKVASRSTLRLSDREIRIF